MDISITRFVSKNENTLGRLSIDGQPFCYTIERPWIDNLPYVSCIPESIYGMVRYDSPSYGADTWMVDQVPDRTYILFHVANVAANVQGCIGLGTACYEDLTGVKNSRIAVDEFYRRTGGEEKATLTIINGICID